LRDKGNFSINVYVSTHRNYQRIVTINVS